VSVKVLFQAFSDQRFLFKRLFPRVAELTFARQRLATEGDERAKHTGTEDLSPRSGHCDLARSSPALRPLMLLSALRPGTISAGPASNILQGHHLRARTGLAESDTGLLTPHLGSECNFTNLLFRKS